MSWLSITWVFHYRVSLANTLKINIHCWLQKDQIGLTLLRDVIAPNSLTIIALGSDHFFAEDPKINAKTIALTILVISYLEGKKPNNINVIDSDRL